MPFYRFFVHFQFLGIAVITQDCATQESCSVEEEAMSMIQVRHVDNRTIADNVTAACDKFFIEGCQMNVSDVPRDLEQMRSAFLTCCLQNSYGSTVCDLASEYVFNELPNPADFCFKFADVQEEHERAVKFATLQQRATLNSVGAVGAIRPNDMDTAARGKLGFGTPRSDYFCDRNRQQGLQNVHYQANLRKCKRECEFSPVCAAISYSNTQQCVLCATPSLTYFPSWTTYVKRSTTRRSKQVCKNDKDCDYPGCNLFGWFSWQFHCFKEKGREKGQCTNRRVHEKRCEGRFANQSTFPGQWCHSGDLYRLCPRRKKHRNNGQHKRKSVDDLHEGDSAVHTYRYDSNLLNNHGGV